MFMASKLFLIRDLFSLNKTYARGPVCGAGTHGAIQLEQQRDPEVLPTGLSSLHLLSLKPAPGTPRTFRRPSGPWSPRGLVNTVYKLLESTQPPRLFKELKF